MVLANLPLGRGPHLKTEYRKIVPKVCVARRKELTVMLDLKVARANRNHSKRSCTKYAGPGIYDSVVISVDQAKDYEPGTAIEVTRRLTNAVGKAVTHKETFIIGGYIPERTNDFEDYLDVNGIVEYSDYVGCEERVTLRKQSTPRGVFTNIVAREFVSKPTTA